MKHRTIAHILPAESLNMGGTLVKQPLPTVQVEQVSPFLLLHHFGPTEVEAGVDPLDVGPHPHRGFEPVTFLYSGGIRHKDSRGNEGLLHGGDVQWMTAGRGIIHSERASRDFLEQGGRMEGIQLWVNLARKNKMAQPRYQDIKAQQIPVLPLDRGTGELRIIAGAYRETKGPAETYTKILAMQLKMQAGAHHRVEIPGEFNALVYLLDGKIKLPSGFEYEKETLLHFHNDGEVIELESKAASRLLLLAGEPIEEPVAQWGPYVMNTQTEIMEAMRDYQMGKMGVYID